MQTDNKSPIFPREENSAHGLTLRAVVLGLFLVAFLAVVTPIGDSIIRGTMIAYCHLPVGAVVLFVILVAVLNPGLKKLGIALTHAELIIIYSMMLIGAGIPSFGLSGFLIPVMAAPRYFATPENDWQNLFFQYLPDWLFPADTKAIKYFYEGLPSGIPFPFRTWLRPLLSWTFFALAFYWVSISICVILRKQWVERERLLFPLVQFAVEMVEEGKERSAFPPFFRNSLMWVGFAIPTFIHTINGLHFHFPNIPWIPLSFDLRQYLTTRPWTAINYLRGYLYFSVLGFVYLLPVDLSFSLWFFYFFFQAQYVVGDMLGMRPDVPLIGHVVKSGAAYQMAGACIGLVGFILWRTRRHLLVVLRSVIVKTSREDDSAEIYSYRVAVIGVILGFAIMCAISAAAGVSILIMLGILVVLFIIMIALMRFVSEGGILYVHTSFRPLDVISQFAGTSRIPPASLTYIAASEMVFMTTIQDFLMPSVMDTFKLSDVGRLRRRSLLKVIIGSILVSIGVSYVSILTIAYKYGAVNLGGVSIWPGRLAYNRLHRLLITPESPSQMGVFYLAIGAVSILFLGFMRQRFLWWPFHPLGYAMGATWPMVRLWFSSFLGWFFKWLTLKYSGIAMYRKLRTLFFGMILGEYLSSGIWLIIDFATHKSGHALFLAG